MRRTRRSRPQGRHHDAHTVTRVTPLEVALAIETVGPSPRHCRPTSGIGRPSAAVPEVLEMGPEDRWEQSGTPTLLR